MTGARYFNARSSEFKQQCQLDRTITASEVKRKYVLHVKATFLMMAILSATAWHLLPLVDLYSGN